MPIPAANERVEAARVRRAEAAGEKAVRIEWFVKEVSEKVRLSMRQRVRLATDLVRNKVVTNISRPVTKGTGPSGGRIVTDRSKRKEFPKAETTQLMKTIFGEVVETSPGVFDGFIGTPLDYGLILETNERLDRSFLVRTLNEERAKVTRILSGPLK